MAITSGYFNSVNGDRKYNADQMSEYFEGIINEGVCQHIGGGLAVTAGTGLTVSVATGKAFIGQKWIKNDAALTLTITTAADQARIDAVVLRRNTTNRVCEIAVKTGTPSASPSAPAMTRTSTTYEMALAYVNVAAGATSVTVTDKRADTTVCGWATVAQETSGEVDQMLNDMKTGFDGVVYPSPAAQVIGSDETLNSRLLDYVYGGTKTFTISSTGTNKFKMLLLKGVNYTFTNNTSASCTLRIYKQDGTSLLISSGVSAGISINFNPDAVDYILIGGWYDGTGSVSVASSYGDLNNPYIRKLYDYTSLCTWEIGSVYGSNGNDNDENQAAIRTPKNKKIFVEDDCIVQSVNEDVTTLYAFKYNTSGTFISRLGESGKTYINIDGGYVYRFVCFSKDSVVITSDTISHYSAEFYLCGTTLGAIIKDVFPREDYIKGYSIGADLIKRDIKAIRVGTGTLKYRQSFLMYNGKYYSTNGSKIAVQSSNFTVEQEVSLAVGHGNAFVLGTGNKGYISGWDDNTIYVIDLDNLTISSTITLPTTGYTTAAIDDVNEIIYIFQRDTSTSTESVYNYIVYDYANDSVIDTYKTTVPFSAMQACDILHDRIIVLNGYGTVSNPNGYRVYNLQGQILAEYTFDDLSGTEPEGVFIDRSTWDMYISDVDGKVYQITQ